MKKLILLFLFFSTICNAQETIVNYDSRSLPVLNEQLRKSYSDINSLKTRITTLEAASTDVDLTSDVTGVLPLANGGTGQALTDPAADRIIFWDDSESKVQFLTAGDRLTISGTTISADLQSASGITLPNYADGTTVEEANNTERCTTSLSYVKLKGFTAVARAGTITIKFEHKSASSDSITTRLYKNGVYDGSHSASRANIAYAVVTWTGITVAAGDVLELYALSDSGGAACIQNMELQCSSGTATSTNNYTLNGYNINVTAND